MNLSLKMWRSLPAVFCILCWSLPSFAFDRELTADEVVKLESNAKEDPKNIVARRFLIEHYYREKKWDKVSEFAQEGQAEFPAATLMLVINACLENDDGIGAGAAVGVYHGKFPATAASKTLEGLALTKIARHEMKLPTQKIKAQLALDVFKEAAIQWPKETAPYLAWIATLHEFWPDSADDALQVYKKLENNTGQFENYLVEKCELFVKANLWDQALTVCQRAINKKPDDIDSYIYLAQAQKVKVDIDAAKKTLTKVIDVNPKSAKAHFILANIFFDEKNLISASEQFQETIVNDSNNAEALLGLARSEYQLKKYDEALDAYAKHCKLTRTVASEFKTATGLLRTSNNPLQNKYKKVMSTCR